MQKCLVLFASVTALMASAQAQMIRITVKNLASSTPLGLHHSPVWLGFHDGSFDLFDSGTSASAGIEALAELGDSSLIAATFAASQPFGYSLALNNPGGPGPGIFTPGASNSAVIDLGNGARNYLSFGAMVVPSNDSFIANADPLALSLFDGSGMFLGRQTWVFTGANVWDAGTEVNSPLDGAAFVMGVNAMLGTSEGGLIHGQPLDGLDNVIGLTTPTGAMIGRALSNDPLFSITITPVPEPSTYGLMAAAGLGAVIWWRRRRSSAAMQVQAG